MINDSLYLEKNVGPVDQVFRVILGAVLVVIPSLFFKSPWATVVLAAIGGSLILEGIIAY